MSVRNVSDVMRQRFVHVTPDTSLSEALELMETTRLRFLLVIEDERLIGIVSHKDLRIVRDKLRIENTNEASEDLLEVTSVEIAMTTSPETIRPSCSLAEAEQRLHSVEVGVIPVTTGRACAERLVGIVVESDLPRDGDCLDS